MPRSRLELDPDDPRIYSFRAYSRTRLDLYQEAIPDFDRAIEIDPQSAWSYRWRGGDYDIETGERLAKRSDMEI